MFAHVACYRNAYRFQRWSASTGCSARFHMIFQFREWIRAMDELWSELSAKWKLFGSANHASRKISTHDRTIGYNWKENPVWRVDFRFSAFAPRGWNQSTATSNRLHIIFTWNLFFPQHKFYGLFIYYKNSLPPVERRKAIIILPNSNHIISQTNERTFSITCAKHEIHVDVCDALNP